MISINDLLINFVALASKSAKISRILREERSLFESLVEEKETNEYLDVDYKTFGDVLIQETVRYNLRKITKGDGLKLFGEESNEFTNKLDQKIKMNITDCWENTKELIGFVLNGHDQLQRELCTLVHGDSSEFLDDADRKEIEDKVADSNLEFDQNDLEIWIDPIDGTRQYVNGTGISSSVTFDDSCSLYKVTVLIGAYIKSTGQPLLGVVCQPFHERSVQGTQITWKQNLYWGYHFDNKSVHSNNVFQPTDFQSTDQTSVAYVCVSSIEYEEIKVRLDDYFHMKRRYNSREWQVHYSPGAGYKFLELFSGNRQCYLVTEASTYKWDVCGPHAILRSINNQDGGLIDFKNTIEQLQSDSSDLPNDTIPKDYGYKLLESNQIKYSSNQKESCNVNGILGYVNKDIALELLQIFR